MLKNKPLPSQEELERMFRLNQETGDLIWKFREEKPKNINSRQVGKIAGWLIKTGKNKGYIKVKVKRPA